MEVNELLIMARQLLKERMNSLQSDVRYCILRNEKTPDWPAPFPALLYCFATIDLLGSLYGGDAKSSTGISERSQNYMTDIMKYPKEKAELLQKVFRHKIVHLAQPKPVTKMNGKKYLWEYHHNNRGIHLSIDTAGQKEEFWFRISIWSLVKDIVDSVFKPNGYLHRLEKEQSLQRNFEKAYQEIFEQ